MFICRLIVSIGVMKVSTVLGYIERTKYKLEEGELVYE